VTEKLGFLEGLRGVAALIVVFGHFQGFLAGFLGPMTGFLQIGSLPLKVSYHMLLYPFTNPAPVPIFFVLSGYVLTVKFFRTDDPSKKRDVYLGGALKRYPRLMIPALVSILIVFLFLCMGWLHDFGGITAPSLAEALRQGLYDAYFTFNNGHDSTITYNGVLWTMYYEFTGSIMVFAFLAMFGDTRYRRYLYAPILLVFLGTHYMGFILGLMLADFYNSTNNARAKADYRIPLALLVVICAALCLYLFNYNILGAIDVKLVYIYLGVSFIMALLLSSRSLQWVFSRKPMLFLGKISFSMYLLHPIILGSFSVLCFTAITAYTGSLAAASLTFISSLLIIFGVSYLYYRSVDSWSIRTAKHIYEIIKGDREKPAKTKDIPQAASAK
jgi:peptidoglycan/LPS O-acetylase OafA/YrhL